MTIKRLFNQNTDINPQWLLFLRVTVAVFTLLHFGAIQPDFANLYGTDGFVKPDIMNAQTTWYHLTVYKIFVWIAAIDKSISFDDVLRGLGFLYPLALIGLAVGFCTRISAVVSILLHLVFINSISLYQYGVDSYTTILLFYCILFPVGQQLSVDSLIFKQKTEETSNRYLYLIQTHICIAYFFSGFDKLMGENWRNGEALWKAVTSYNELGLIDFTPLYNTPTFFIMGWATIVIEMLYPLFINVKKTREIWLVLTIGLHLSIMVTMGLFFFSTVMIIFNLVTYYIPYLQETKSSDASWSFFKTSLQRHFTNNYNR